jgi:hypothetical protein
VSIKKYRARTTPESDNKEVNNFGCVRQVKVNFVWSGNSAGTDLIRSLYERLIWRRSISSGLIFRRSFIRARPWSSGVFSIEMGGSRGLQAAEQARNKRTASAAGI